MRRHFVVALCYSTSRAAVELALDMSEHAERARAQTVLAEFPDSPVLLGVSKGVPRAKGVAVQSADDVGMHEPRNTNHESPP